MTTTRTPDRLLSTIREGNRFLLTSHRNPDGDAVGSELGLARVLRKLGKGATVWNRDATPPLYRSMVGSDRIHVGEEPPPGFPDAFTAGIVLECPRPERTGLAEHLEELNLVNIDHHLGNEQYGDINWVDTGAPALGEMIYALAKDLKVTMDSDTATCLYLTIVSDTGGFRFANTTPQAFDAAAALVREGADPETVSHWIYESQPLSAMRLLGEMLDTLRLHDQGRVATAALTSEMFERAGAETGDSEGLVDYPRSIRGVEACGLLRQLAPEKFKISLRSRGDIDVQEVARAHGGGGHKNAAGCVIEGEIEDVRDRVAQALIDLVE